MLTVVLAVFAAMAFVQTYSAPQPDLEAEIRTTKWSLDDAVRQAKADLDYAQQYGLPQDRQAKPVLADVSARRQAVWKTFEQTWQSYQTGTVSEQKLNEAYIQAKIEIYLLDASLLRSKEHEDPDLYTQYQNELDWLDDTAPDSQTYTEYMKNENPEARHLSFVNRKTRIEKFLQDLERGYPLATGPARGPGLYIRNYFAQKNLSGFILPVIMIAFFLMNAMELHRSRAIFYSRSLPVSAFRFWWVQLFASLCAAVMIFLVTFFAGFLLSGLCFGWTDLRALVPVDPSVWNTDIGAQMVFASANMTEPLFSTTTSGVGFYSDSLQWIPCCAWAFLTIGLELWLIFMQALTVCSLSFISGRRLTLVLTALWMVMVCVLRFGYTPFSLLPLFWPSPVDMLYGGFGIGWGVWLGASLIYVSVWLMADKLCIGRKDVR